MAISDEDIQHLHNTISRILEVVKETQSGEKIDKRLDSLEQIKELISVDTLKTMQLLGFNYKAAIGEPLTLMLRNYILSYVKNPDSLELFEKVVTPEMVDILKDDSAFQNFKELMNIAPETSKK